VCVCVCVCVCVRLCVYTQNTPSVTSVPSDRDSDDDEDDTEEAPAPLQPLDISAEPLPVFPQDATSFWFDQVITGPVLMHSCLIRCLIV
jgi:hypothetical protein